MSASTNHWARPAPDDPMEYTHYVAANVRALMGRHRVSGVQLASWIDVSPSQVSKRLSGKIPFDTQEIGRMAIQFNVDTAVITGGWVGPRGPATSASDSRPTMAYADAVRLRLVPDADRSAKRVAA